MLFFNGHAKQVRKSSIGKENWHGGNHSMVFVGVNDHAVFCIPLIRTLDLVKYPLFKGSRIHSRVIKLFVISVGVNIKVLYVGEKIVHDMLNNIGPSTFPCGTPLVIFCHPEKEPPTLNLRVLPLR